MEILEELIKRSMEEFGRAVEMFTGEKPELTFVGPSPDLSESEISGRTWWKQIAQGAGSFVVGGRDRIDVDGVGRRRRKPVFIFRDGEPGESGDGGGT